MATVAHYIHALVEVLLVPFDQLPPWLALALQAALMGTGMLWVVGKTSPQWLIERARDQMSAAILEIRLSLDAPLRVFACQGRLVAWSLLYLASLLPPVLLLSGPLGLFYLHLDARHGLGPLPVDQDFVVEVDLAPGVTGDDVEVTARPDALALTAPVLFDASRHRAYARARFAGPESAQLSVRVQGRSYDKTLSADPHRTAYSPERTSGLRTLWSPTLEKPLSGPVTRIAVAQPAHTRTVMWLPWWLYWLLIATATALSVKNRLGVSI